MEKRAIVVIVLLLALVIGVKYLSDRGNGPAGQAGEAAASALQTFERPEGPQAVASSANSNSSWGPKAAAIFPRFDKDPNADTGICEGSSVKDALNEYGKVWGRGVNNPVIREGEAEELMTMIQDYFICRAIVMDDTAECGPLPDNMDPPQKRTRRNCAYKTDTMLIAAYMAGRHKSFTSCARFCKWVDATDIQENPQKHCPSFAKGLEHFCDTAPADRLQECRGAYPTKRSDCDIPRKPGDKNPDTCPDRYDLYMAMKAGDAELCPSRYKAACTAFVSKDMAVCSSMAMTISSVYCTYKERMRVESAQKRPDFGKLKIKAPEKTPEKAPEAPKLEQQQRN